MSLTTYQRVRAMVETPRRAECRLMREITGEMMSARDAGIGGARLMVVLHRNREVWGAFASACAAPGNLLGPELRANIVSLGLWVERFTSGVMRGAEPIDELIAVNRLIIEGLSGEVADAAA